MTTDLAALGLAIKRAQHRNHRTAEVALRRLGVTLVQWDALRAIDRLPHGSGHDLAVATFQSDQSFGTLASRLADRGLVFRAAGPGRRLEHHLTDEGRTILRAGDRIMSRVLEGLFSPLNESQRDTLAEILQRLITEDGTQCASSADSD